MNLITLSQTLLETSNTLASNGIDEARLEAELLLRHVLGLSKTELHIQLANTISQGQIEVLNRLIQRRLSHEPLAYITGEKEFYGLCFYVNQNTLIPRPETELLVEKVLALTHHHPAQVIADIGTGCGAIAIAIAAHSPLAKVHAIDIETSALQAAALNVKRHGVEDRVYLQQGNLLLSLPESVDIIVANLPYISDSQMEDLSDDIRFFEPKIALCGGPDGLHQVRQLIAQAKGKLLSGGTILLEIGPGQAMATVGFAEQHFREATVRIETDLSGQERLISIKSKSCK